MKLKDIYITKQVRDTYVMVGVGKDSFNGIVNANDSAGFIIDCLKTDTTRQQIIEKMLEVYDTSADIVAEDVDKVLEALKSINAIDE